MSVTDLDNRTICDALEVMRYGAADAGYIRTYAAGRIRYDIGRREVYSYGGHFPLFRYVPREVSGAPDLFVINGDVWRQSGPTRTPDHQSSARRRIELTGARSIVLPFSALDGAGIDIDSIRPLSVEPDRHVTVEHSARSLAEVPRHDRRVAYRFTHCRATLDRLPAAGRTEWRAPTDLERGGSANEYARTLPRLPGADGLYRYTETRYRDLEPESDGRYYWTTTAHILGESTFSAVRAETLTRPADPFEHERETARVTVELWSTDSRRRYCPGADGAPHESGPAGACIHCADPLSASETTRRRRRYLSSFDTNEAPALYFLAQLPRGAATDTAGALESLAPAAVHAARARGREVARQGDIFLVDTDLTREDLAARGATFARRTQWTRNAAPRAGEITYRAPLRAAERRRRAVLELRYARRLWRQRWRAIVEPAGLEHGPETGRRGARQASRARALAVERVETKRAALRRAILAGPEWSGRYRPSGEHRRNAHVAMVERAREDLAGAVATARAGRLTRAAGARDGYRDRYGTNARNLWRQCLNAAAHKYRPAEMTDTGEWSKRREMVRRAVSIYGTAHAATETARVGSAVYVRGTVTHEPDLEPGRNGGRDHRPLALTPDRWYLAVRNAVPRQTRRRRRRNVSREVNQG